MVSEPSSDQHHTSAAMVSDKQRFAKIETSIAQLSEALQTMSLQLGRRLNGDKNGGERRNRRRRDDGQTEWGTGHVKSTIRRRNWSDNEERTSHNRREDRRSGEGGSRRHPKHVRGDNIRVRENPLYDESEESDASLQNEWNESLKDTRLKMGESSSAGLFARSGSLFDQHIKWVEGEYDGPRKYNEEDEEDMPQYDEAEGEAREEEASFEEEQPRYDVETDFEEAGCRIVIEFMSWGKESQETQPFASEFDGKSEEEESTDGESVTAEIESQHEEFPTLEVLQAGVDVHVVVVVAEEHEQEVVAEIGTDLIPNKLTEWSLNSFVKKEGVFESGSFKESLQDSVEWFNVFKTSKLKAVEKANDNNEDKLLLGKKEYHQQMERDALFQKKHKVHVSGSNIPSPFQSFVELRSRHNCRSYLVHNLAELGFKEPTPIQRQAIPVLLSGRECFACAPTGSGKTFAFVCPILVKLGHASKDGIRAVILCPTRELAAQTARECKKLCKGKKFYIKLMTKQLAKSAEFSKQPCDILISTPFRVRYAVRKRKLDLCKVEFLVLDEADKLFELGLVKEVDAVVKACSNPSIVRSLFSATLPDTVEELARTIMHDAVRVIIGRKNSASESIKQRLVFVGSEEGKLLALRQSFAESLNPPVLIFVQNKERAKELYNELKYDEIRADVIHADLSEIQRETAVDNFRAGKTWVLIATDVIARGMDFKGVNCVINYDFPDSMSAYIHRIGRSGRAGRSGEAITLYTEADVPYLRNIANVMTASGCEVPSFILSLDKKKWRKHRPNRQQISTKPEEEEKQ